MKPLFAVILSLLILSNLRAQIQAQTPAPSSIPASQTTTSSQQAASPKEHRFFAGLSLGPSFPTGKFANKNYSDTTAGWAQPGPSFNLSAGYMLTRSVGIVLLLGAQENKQDANTITSHLKQQYGDTVRSTVTTNNWKIARILAGGLFKLPVSESGKLFFQAKVLAGVLKTSAPAYSYAYGQPQYFVTYGYSVYATIGSVPLNWAFCYQGNAGLGWRLTKRISLVGDVSYFHAAPVHKYDHYLIFTPGGGFYDRGPWQKKYIISSVNLMAGAEITF